MEFGWFLLTLFDRMNSSRKKQRFRFQSHARRLRPMARLARWLGSAA
jgi:hypothetical protein